MFRPGLEVDLDDPTTFAKFSEWLNEPYKEYWAELGQFIHVFSGIEFALHSLATHLSGMDDAVAKAVFSGLRVDNAKDTINRILEAKGEGSLSLVLVPLFAQLGVISGVRNHLVHWGAKISDDNRDGPLVVSNQNFAFSSSRLKSYEVTATDLAGMREDLRNIQIRLLRVRFHNDEKGMRLMGPLIEEVEAAPWRYKPQQQSLEPKTRGTRERRREQSRQHDASPKSPESL